MFFNKKLKDKISTLEYNLESKQSAVNSLREQLSKKETELQTTQSAYSNAQLKAEAFDNYCQSKQEDLKHIFSSKKEAFPYVALLMSDYLTYDLQQLELAAQKGKYYARTYQAIKLKEIRAETKELLSEAKQYEYQLKYLLDLFPDLADYLEFDDSIDLEFKYNDSESNEDPILAYISAEEYRTLSETDKNQLALDRYIQSHKKSKWQIGRDYELSVGYQYEKKGYHVQYNGSLEGVSDLGRDLIATKDDVALIIQCKYWSSEKTIHEKHIAQLYGTTLCYKYDYPKKNVKPVFITSTQLSNEAKLFAKKLGVTYVEQFAFIDFPRIKCNIGRDEFGETKIYHLPMDQQYDSVVLKKPGEKAVFTVEEAEKSGFRRAYRWHNS